MSLYRLLKKSALAVGLSTMISCNFTDEPSAQPVPDWDYSFQERFAPLMQEPISYSWKGEYAHLPVRIEVRSSGRNSCDDLGLARLVQTDLHLDSSFRGNFVVIDFSACGAPVPRYFLEQRGNSLLLYQGLCQEDLSLKAGGLSSLTQQLRTSCDLTVDDIFSMDPWNFVVPLSNFSLEEQNNLLRVNQIANILLEEHF